MSRIGKKPVVLPEKVKAKMEGMNLTVEGPKGKLIQPIHPRIKLEIAANQIVVNRGTNIPSDRALHGLMRSLIANMIEGVTEGFKKDLELEGVGYKAQMKGKILNLLLGFTHPIDYEVPEGVEVKCPKPTIINVTGMDKQKVGQVAAEIRRFHKPEPYKGKGVRYAGEKIRRKQGKTVS